MKGTHARVPFPETMRQPVFFYNGGFLTQKRVRRILSLAGYDLKLGLPRTKDLVAVWGNSPTAYRGRKVAQARGADLLFVEDAFLRSLHPGRLGEPPLGLVLDRQGAHFDPAQPSDLEALLATHPLDDPTLLARSKAAIARLRENHLSKYNAFDPSLPVPDAGYVLLIDQTRNDASVRASGGDRASFLTMLEHARADHPNTRILIKSHPETRAGQRLGHFAQSDLCAQSQLLETPVSPWSLLNGAKAVYTLSSQLGFEAILCGHKPQVFGAPFYAGWGLSTDRAPLPRRTRRLRAEQLFAAAMILYPKWYDPYRDELCALEVVLDTLEARTRAWREDHRGWVAAQMRLWKRKPLTQFFGQSTRVVFQNDPQKAKALAQETGRRCMIWASKATGDAAGMVRVEDGFLRSRGLGAELVPPLSLVTDSKGIYYDPTGPSQIEALITQRADLRPDQAKRIAALIRQITASRISKYNLGGQTPDLPKGHRILVPGQVEDDASIRLGAGAVRTNQALLETVRSENPNAVILFKPHPDVEAGLRPGAVEAEGLADLVLEKSDPAALLDQVQEVWTMTSLLGFEALLRNVPVTTLGMPFYAGWGLTTDFQPAPERRSTRPALEGLAYATLIDYPRYFDPISRTACPPEVVVERLAMGRLRHPGLSNRLLSKAQGLLASHAYLWRRR